MATATSTKAESHVDDIGTASPMARASTTDNAAQQLPRDDFDRDVWCLLGMPVDIANIDRAVSAIDASARTRRKLSFVTPNVNWLVRALGDQTARREILEADLSFIDGAPLVAIAKMLDIPATTRVAGADIFEALRRRPGFGGRRIRVFFFGGRDGAGEAALEALNQEAGGVEAVGQLNPGFGDVESMSTPEIINEINQANPDFVVVALGAAKGQAWIERNKDNLTAPVMSHLGAVVDFTAGEIARAPDMMKKLGLEWAWRIKEEPSLWRRYYHDGLALAGIGLTQLAPQMMKARQQRQAKPGKAEIRHDALATSVLLTGAMTRSGLDDVRNVFRLAATRGADVILDFSEMAHFDRSFLGLVLMLEKHVARNGRKLYVNGATAAQWSMLRANAMEYPRAAPNHGQFIETTDAVTA